MNLRIAIDTGGTFTDVVAINEATGAQHAIKTPSTPSDPSVGLLTGLRKAAEAAGGSPAEVSHVLHGSTTATNAVLEHKFEGLGLLVTDGFRHIIEIARQSVPDGYGNSFFWVKPPRLVPLHLVREVSGRLDFEGNELTPLDEAGVVTAVEQLVADGVTRLGVCLIHSYADAGHEQRVGEIIAKHIPQLFVSLSSTVLPEYREYERAMTTLIDVMVKPYCKTYLNHAAAEIQREAGEIPFLIMQSNGGVVSNRAAGDKPVTMLLSGPAAGVLGAAFMSGLAGFNDILTLDVGGTSTDVSLVENLEPQLTSNSLVENYPVKTPMLDIATVASGGGSIAWVDDYGALKVGPQSAGAEPGPICYGRGGAQPTVTDAALVLGRLPHALVGGEIALDAATAKAAYQNLGERFDMSAEEAAAGVMEIAAANQVHGIRQVSVMKGREPGLYALVAFGGAGGLFAAEVADFLNIRTVLSPPNPGNLSAFGLHVSDIKRDYIRTLVRQQSSANSAEIDAAWAELEAQGRLEIAAEGVAEDAIQVARSADVRYVGEGHEVPVTVPAGLTGDAAVQHIWSEFHQVHMRTFGFAYEGTQDVELVNLRIQAIGRIHRPSVAEPEHDGAAPTVSAQRQVYWRGLGWAACDIYRRENLSPGHTLDGPLVVEEYGSTVVVPDGWRVGADAHGNLKLEKLT
ncbi:MAG: hydantoinase/oxoprolinase family protein [Rhodospirillaceae bacterium]|nr:hydantoinase/oxoprolinase family protein [Rhodospirillaceae bacterium]